MDFRGLCQKIDVDSIRARIPAMPSAVSAAIPQIRLPKSIPKLKSRKIFKSSREDVRKDSTKGVSSAEQSNAAQQQRIQLPAIPPSEFINHTPTRISTISSLMHEQSAEYTYRSACSLEDDYYPMTSRLDRHYSRPISPTRSPPARSKAEMRSASSSNIKMSLTEKLQKGYKDITEFRLKHIFAKKTVVRKDNIEVDYYARKYEEDLKREKQYEENQDQQIADNYRFKFKVSRQNTGHTDSIDSKDSPLSEKGKQLQQNTFGRNLSEQSGDESGMEASPPTRKPGIAATRFAKVKNPPLRQSLSDESYEDQQKLTAKTANTQGKGYKERIRRLTSIHTNSSIEESGNESSPGDKIINKIRGFRAKSEVSAGSAADRKRKAPLSPEQSEEQQENRNTAENTRNTIKENIKRFHKSIKRQQSTTEEQDNEPKSLSKSEKFTARLRRFKSREVSLDSVGTSPKKNEQSKSPIKSIITNKIQNWKKSFKKPMPATDHVDNSDASDNETSPEKRSETLINRLKNLRTRKQSGSRDDLDADESKEESPTNRKATTFEGKFEQARQRTFKKVNEKMAQMKLFHKSQEHIEKELPKQRSVEIEELEEEEFGEEYNQTVNNATPTAAKRNIHEEYQSDEEEEEEEELYVSEQARAVWTEKPILSTDSIESLDNEDGMPRVLIHQDNSDEYESTLIIAVTRSPLPACSPKISEILLDEQITNSKQNGPSIAEWVSDKEIISGFLEVTPPHRRKHTAEKIVPAPRGHVRRLSVDSNSESESLTLTETTKQNVPLSQNQSKEGSRRPSLAALNCIDENEEPWKVHSMYSKEKLYKTKSIDIFETNARLGSISAAFEDFDDELKNAPVVRISNQYMGSSEKESSEEAVDDDSSSKVTVQIKVSTHEEQLEKSPQKTTRSQKKKLQKIGNSFESLVANFDENEEIETDEEDRPPSAAPSPPPCYAPPPPPPSMSPPPPPLPQRKSSNQIVTKPATPPPALPVTKPPTIAATAEPPKIPQRNASMSRVSKPLVKTSSLRLAFDEQVKPADVGKVNKLITRFDPTAKTRPRIVRRHISRDESEEYTDNDEECNLLDQLNGNISQQLPTQQISKKSEREPSPTPTNTPKTKTPNKKQEVQKPNKESAVKRIAPLPGKAILHVSEVSNLKKTETLHSLIEITETDIELGNVSSRQQSPGQMSLNIPRISLNLDNNSNFSCPNSEYGSPLEYPSSLTGSSESTPIPDRRQQDISTANNSALTNPRSRRSLARDDEKFLSFDSDEENSYYSISSSSSSRYIVEI